ncbi:hypothetical protein ACFC1L_34925 [Streptomyces sp. NPDC056210]|uniref:hypothetical protein n=1 Tax=Streptomyces sp. NPDC056210 TaxID=3345746 RepID=UPI0035E2B3CC
MEELGYGELPQVIRNYPGVAAAVKACETLHLEYWVRVGPHDTVPQDRHAAHAARLPGLHRPDPLDSDVGGQWQIQLDHAQMQLLREMLAGQERGGRCPTGRGPT